MISKLIAALHHIDFSPTAEDVADILWLTHQMQRHASPANGEQTTEPLTLEGQKLPGKAQETTSLPTKPEDGFEQQQKSSEKKGLTERSVAGDGKLYPEMQQEGDETSTLTNSRPFKSPTVPALSSALALGRSLRPLARRIPSRTRYIFDEKATAHSIAEHYLADQDSWTPIQHPALEKWLEVALVVDESRSMAIWYQTICELRTLLERHGAFRNVRTWGLSNDASGEHIYLHAGIDPIATSQPRHNYQELIDPTGRRLILLISNCVSRIWHNGVMPTILRHWGRKGPVTIIQTLPEHLWTRSSLDKTVDIFLHASSAGLPNMRLDYKPADYWVKPEQLQACLPVPVIPLQAAAIRTWTHILTGVENIWTPGYAFIPELEKNEQAGERSEKSAIPPTAEQQIKRFRATASPLARDLAVLLAAAPLSLPVVRVIQRTMLPTSDQSHIAEVFLSGMLMQLPGSKKIIHPNYIQYDFVPGIRKLLLDSMPISDSLQVLKEVSDFITDQYGQTLDFRAWLADPTALEGLPISQESRPFASIASQVLRRIGGDYAILAQRLENIASPQKSLAGLNGKDIATDAETSQIAATIPMPEEAHSQLDRNETQPFGRDPEPDQAEKTDAPSPSQSLFYICTAAADRSWADWIAWNLGNNGYSSRIQEAPVISILADKFQELDIILIMPDSLDKLIQPDTFEEFLSYLHSAARTRIIVQVHSEMNSNTLTRLRPTRFINLFGRDSADALARLLDTIDSFKTRPIGTPPYPGETATTSAIQSPSSEAALPLTVFMSFSSADERLAINLEKHLSLLKRQGLISLWNMHDIRPGASWEQEISMHLENARIILLLISPDFIASSYSYNVELSRAMERYQEGEALVVPILLRPTLLEGLPFYGRLQFLPSDGRAVTSWQDQDSALADIAVNIRLVADRLLDRGQEVAASSPVNSATDTVYIPPAPALQPNDNSSSFSSRQASAYQRFSPSLLPEVWNIPPRNPLFTGQEHILQLLRASFSIAGNSNQIQPLALSGLGGIGKTQIAIEYAYRYQGDYQYAFWADATSSETLNADIAQIVQIVRLPAEYASDLPLALRTVKRWLETNTGWLLILDNADNAEVIKAFIPTSGTGHILLTTRARALGRLALRVEIEAMDEETGTLLLLRRARILGANETLAYAGLEDLKTARLICQELGGLPLALDQAGDYIEAAQCSLTDYLTLYQTYGIRLLQERGMLALDHPLPVAITWQGSFVQVEESNPAAADLLRLCSFLHADAIPEEIITEGARHSRASPGPNLGLVATDPLRWNQIISVLGAHSLLHRNATTHMLSIHRLVQAILKDGMDEATQRQWAERAILLVEQVFPFGAVDVERWPQYERLLPQALICVSHSEHFGFTFPEVSRLLTNIAAYFTSRVRFAEAEPLLQRVLYLCEQRTGPDHPDTAISLTNLATLHILQGYYSEAEPLLQRAISIQESKLDPEHPNLARSLNGLADLYYHQGHYQKAERLYQRALSIQEADLGPDHADIARYLNSLARNYTRQGTYTLAESLYQRALSIQEKLSGSDHLNIAASIGGLADLYYHQGRYSEAERLYQRTLSIQEKAFGSDHPDTANSIEGLADLYYHQGHYQEAEHLYQRALAIRERMLGPDHPDLTHNLNSLANLCYDQGRYSEAEPLYQRVLSLYEKVWGPDYPDLVDALFDYASLLRHTGHVQEAERQEARARSIRAHLRPDQTKTL